MIIIVIVITRNEMFETTIRMTSLSFGMHGGGLYWRWLKNNLSLFYQKRKEQRKYNNKGIFVEFEQLTKLAKLSQTEKKKFAWRGAWSDIGLFISWDMMSIGT